MGSGRYVATWLEMIEGFDILLFPSKPSRKCHLKWYLFFDRIIEMD